MIIKKILLLWFNNSVLYFLPYCTQIKHTYRNMYLNYCIKHAKKKKKLQMDYQNLEGTQPLKGVAHTLGLTRTKSAGLRTRCQILGVPATNGQGAAPDVPNHGSRHFSEHISAQRDSQGTRCFHQLKSHFWGCGRQKGPSGYNCYLKVRSSLGTQEKGLQMFVEICRNSSSLPRAIRK